MFRAPSRPVNELAWGVFSMSEGEGYRDLNDWLTEQGLTSADVIRAERAGAKLPVCIFGDGVRTVVQVYLPHAYSWRCAAEAKGVDVWPRQGAGASATPAPHVAPGAVQ